MVKKGKKGKNAKKEVNYKVIGIIALVLILVLIFVVFGGSIFKENKKTYLVYQLPCDKEEGYFEDISIAAWGRIDVVKIVKEIKNQSNYCEKSEVKEMTFDEVDKLKLKCECIERAIFTCPEGFELDGELCVKKDENRFTSRLKACSMYACENDYYIEVIINEKI